MRTALEKEMISGLLDELEKIANVGHYTEAITDAFGAPGAAIGQYAATKSGKEALKAFGGSLAATGVGVGIERAVSPWTDSLAKTHPGTAAALRFGIIAAPEAVNIAMMARRRAMGR